jgi:outer membrane receptor protein involved in Fe transport
MMTALPTLRRPLQGPRSVAGLFALLLGFGIGPGLAAQEPGSMATLVGTVVDAATGEPLAGVAVSVEGTTLRVLTGPDGRYRLANVPPGPQVLRAERLGYAPSRTPLTVPPRGEVVRDLRIAVSALDVEGITVTADAGGRARGELATASVIGREAIRTQTAASLAGILELVPGSILQPPGLDGVQQISLRAVPVTSGGPANVGMASASQLTSFGTLIVLDGVPMSNNANLQSLGPRGEVAGFATSAGGGIDLRRIPATTIERVEVIRGIPSARYGDLTQGAIIVDTRAGEVEPEMLLRHDARTGEVTGLGGRRLWPGHAATASLAVARTRISAGTRDDQAIRVAAQLAHRGTWGDGPTGGERLRVDTRIDFFRMEQDQPEAPELQPGFAANSRDTGLRASQRASLALGDETDLTLTTSLDFGSQSSFRQGFRIRAAMPFTDRLTEGRAEGFYVGGQYLSALQIDGEPRQLFGRLEGTTSMRALGAVHEVRSGVEVRREWNPGAGYQFDMATPPQVGFNGVDGFDRPRRFDELPALAATAVYVNDRITHVFSGDVVLRLQIGARLDLLHEGPHWLSGARDAVVQPRFTAELSPVSWLRLRGGVGRTAKLPALQHLHPAPQYYDVVNVNWFANDPAERLAVLTTFVLDPANPDLGFSQALKSEAGIEVDLGPGAGISLVAFEDRISGGVGLSREPGSFLREYFQLADSTSGTGQPPQIIEPSTSADTVPILLDRPANNLDLRVRGFELTASLPEIRPLRIRVQVQGAWIRNRLDRGGFEFSRQFSQFQMQPDRARVPYWDAATSTGKRTVLTSRIVHHQPAVGLVVTGTIQHVLHDERKDLGDASDLSFIGYLTRDGRQVPIAPGQQGNPEFADLREGRVFLVVDPQEIPNDWILSLQVSKTLPGDGRLAFYAFNALDRQGRFGQPGVPPRTHPPIRFGLELTVPAASLVPWL